MSPAEIAASLSPAQIRHLSEVIALSGKGTCMRARSSKTLIVAGCLVRVGASAVEASDLGRAVASAAAHPAASGIAAGLSPAQRLALTTTRGVVPTGTARALRRRGLVRILKVHPPDMGGGARIALTDLGRQVAAEVSP